MATKNRHLSMLILSHQIAGANNRGNGFGGNAQNLQQLQYNDNTYTVWTGGSIRKGQRDSMQARFDSLDKLELLHRKSNVTDAASGYGFGPKNAKTQIVGFQDQGKDGSLPISKTYDGVSNGYMIPDIDKRKGAFETSLALSVHPYDSGTLFRLGLKPDPKEGKSDLNPFTTPVHVDEYFFLAKFCLLEYRDLSGALNEIVYDLGHGFAVGGNHSSCLSEYLPQAIIWRFHVEPAGRLYTTEMPMNGNKLDLPALQRRFLDYGLEVGRDYHLAGLEICDLSIHDAVKKIQDEAEATLALWRKP